MSTFARVLFTASALWLSCNANSCTKSPKPIPDWGYGNKTETEPGSAAQVTDPKEITHPDDLVLIYGGGRHRNPVVWDEGLLSNYVSYADRNGMSDWLFDGFLLLEFMDPKTNGGAGVTYTTGYKWENEYMPSAGKKEWQYLIDYYCAQSSGAGAIDKAVGTAIKKLGQPKNKRKIVISIPSPIKYEYDKAGNVTSGKTDYWGELDGKQLDFSKDADRIAACKWYIDETIKAFAARKYENVELCGFYWVAENSSQTSTILRSLSDYLISRNYSFNWIPYYNAIGYTQWSSYGFTQAYLQPNYFFNASTPASRLDDACKAAIQYKMGMEIEFDNNALVSYDNRGYKLRDYMEYFKKYKVWDDCRLAYYQCGWSVRDLKNSSNEEDKALYYDFCDFVAKRPFHNK
jgi:hypothetical protein